MKRSSRQQAADHGRRQRDQRAGRDQRDTQPGAGSRQPTSRSSRSMKPPKSVYVCQECGAQAQKWMGRCADCGAWNSLVEERASRSLRRRPAASGAPRYALGGGAGARLYADIQMADAPRLATGIEEFDRVLGGGIVPGSLVLLGGEPGIGKSTLLLQAAASFARTVGPVLYSSGEESEHQVKSRGERLGVGDAPIYLLAETCLERMLEEAARLKPGAAGRRLDPDRLLAEAAVGARQHRAGARGGDAAAVHREGAQPADLPRRPRHQGRQPRRAEVARAHRRHRALLRGRAAPRPPDRPRGEEPVRRGVASSACSR